MRKVSICIVTVILVLLMVLLSACQKDTYANIDLAEIIEESRQKDFEEKDCYNMRDNSAYAIEDADTCFLSVAIKKESLGICRSIKGRLAELCISEVVTDMNGCILNQLPKELQTKCLKRVAVRNKDLSSCYAIDYDYEEDIEDCVYQVSEASVSEEPCLTLNEPAEEECLTKLRITIAERVGR